MSFPSDIISFVGFRRLRDRLTLRDLSEMLLLRGFIVSHEAVRDWATKLLPILGDPLRKRRHGTRREAGISWYVDETYLKVRGRWCYLYWANNRDGNLIDAMLSEQRDMRAAKAFFRSAKATMGFRPDRMTTDGHGSYPRAIRAVLGETVRHWTSVYLNNRLEQDYRGIKGRIRFIRGFKSLTPRAASVASMVNSEISFVPAVATTRLSQPLSAAPVLLRPLRLTSTSCASRKKTRSICLRRYRLAPDLTEPMGVPFSLLPVAHQ